MSLRVLVIGKTGQLARELALRAPNDLAVTAIGRPELDLANPTNAAAFVRDFPCDAVINASAYTAVDKAESELDAAMLLNAEAPGAIAAACAARDIPFVHVSTDYVFDGEKSAPYVETDATEPQGAYGRSKLTGETFVLTAGERAAIIRTSWVYASHGANFLRTMLRLAETRDELGVVADQFGRPTWAADLADVCLAVTRELAARNANAQGVFHYAGAGDATWADFAEAIFAASAQRGGPSARVRRITTAEYPTPAKRPANSRLDTTKIEALGVTPRPWREAVALCMDEIAAQRGS
ncbi:MAG: dTDP-4-dehydrorhamnose reductase [Terricaulis sp.]